VEVKSPRLRSSDERRDPPEHLPGPVAVARDVHPLGANGSSGIPFITPRGSGVNKKRGVASGSPLNREKTIPVTNQPSEADIG